MPQRILAIDKETSRLVPLIKGSRVISLTTAQCSWNFAKVELDFIGPYENPDLICPNLTIGMCQTNRPIIVEFHLHDKVHRANLTDQAMKLIPVGDVGRWSSFDSHSTFFVSINNSLFIDIALDAGLTSANGLSLTAPFEDEFIKSAMITLNKEAELGFAGGQLYGDSIATAVAAHLLTRHVVNGKALPAPKGGLSSTTLRAVTDSLKENYNRDISLADLSALAHLSPFHFSRLFKHSTGMTPHQYLIHLRVKRAKELLTCDRVSLKQLAKEVGFWDASHLSRHFKRIYGVSLSELQQQ